MFKSTISKAMLVLTLGILFLSLGSTAAQARVCSFTSNGSACIDNDSPLVPAEVLQVEVPSAANRVGVAWRQLGNPASGSVLGLHLVTAGPPGGMSTYKGVFPPESSDGFFVRDANTQFQVSYSGTPDVGIANILETVAAPAVAPEVKVGAHVSRFSFTARRAVRAIVLMKLSAHHRKETVSRTEQTAKVGVGNHQVVHRLNAAATCRAAGYKSCTFEAIGKVYTKAAGKWYLSMQATAKRRFNV